MILKGFSMNFFYSCMHHLPSSPIAKPTQNHPNLSNNLLILSDSSVDQECTLSTKEHQR